MRKFYCDICDQQFIHGFKAEKGNPCTGSVGALISGLDICEPCMDVIRRRNWDAVFLAALKKEVDRHGEKQQVC